MPLDATIAQEWSKANHDKTVQTWTGRTDLPPPGPPPLSLPTIRTPLATLNGRQFREERDPWTTASPGTKLVHSSMWIPTPGEEHMLDHHYPPPWPAPPRPWRPPIRQPNSSPAPEPMAHYTGRKLLGQRKAEETGDITVITGIFSRPASPTASETHQQEPTTKHWKTTANVKSLSAFKTGCYEDWRDWRYTLKITAELNNWDTKMTIQMIRCSLESRAARMVRKERTNYYETVDQILDAFEQVFRGQCNTGELLMQGINLYEPRQSRVHQLITSMDGNPFLTKWRIYKGQQPNWAPRMAQSTSLLEAAFINYIRGEHSNDLEIGALLRKELKAPWAFFDWLTYIRTAYARTHRNSPVEAWPSYDDWCQTAYPQGVPGGNDAWHRKEDQRRYSLMDAQKRLEKGILNDNVENISEETHGPDWPPDSVTAGESGGGAIFYQSDQ